MLRNFRTLHYERFAARGWLDTSMKVAEHELLPHVRNLPKDTLLIADGFSCREQVRQTTDRFPLHIAQVLQMAQRRDNTASRSYPEEPYITRARATPSVMTVVTLLALVSAVTSSLFARRHRR